MAKKDANEVVEDIVDALVYIGNEPIRQMGKIVHDTAQRTTNTAMQAGKQVTDQVSKVADSGINRVEDLLSADESAAGATTMILWIVGIGGLALVAFLGIRAWMK